MRLRPTSLAGQMLLLVAAALIVAQAINLAFLLNEARTRGANFFEGGAIARTVDAADRISAGDPIDRLGGWGMRRVAITSGAPAALPDERDHRLEARTAQAFADAGLAASNIRAGRMTGPRGRDLLVVAVQLSDARWITTRNFAPPPSSDLVAPLIGQTVILLLALLVAVVLIGRRVARPLWRLTEAAESFGTTMERNLVEPRGPTDVQQLIGTFNEMQSRILGMLEEKDRMLGAIGHDLRTPLASLRMRAESVEDEGERKKMTETIEEMARTLEEILSLARLGRSSEEKVCVELNALIDSLSQDLQDLGMSIEFKPGERLPAQVRPALLRRAIRNLLENAVKYGRRANVRLLKEGSEAVVLIDDRGPGIPDEDLERVMDGFVRLEPSRNRQTGGSGLGLTIARSIVQEHGGSLRLENLDEGGLRVTVRIPA